MTFSEVPIADVERYWNARPCNIRHSDAPVGSPEYFAQVRTKKYKVEPHIRPFAEFWTWRGKRVLDVGCGIGTMACDFARAGARVTALDVSRESLNLATQNGQGLDIEWVYGDAEQLTNLVAWNYDLVWSFGVIHHSPHPERILSQMAKVTGRGAQLRLMVYHRHSSKAQALIRGRYWKADEMIARASEAQSGCPITYTYTRHEIAELVRAAGFQVISVEPAHIFPYAIGPYQRHELVKRWYWRMLPVERIAQRWGWHLLVKAVRL